MRILHLDSGREMRGGQWQALRLMRGLRAAGWDSALRCRAGGPLFERANAEGFEVGALGFWDFPACDLIHAHDARSHTLAVLRGRRNLVVSRRVAFPVRSRWKYRRAERFIAVSRYVAKTLEAGGVPSSKIDVVYDGVPLLPGWLPGLPSGSAGDGTILIPPQKQAALAIEAANSLGLPVRLSRDLEADLAGARLLIYITDCEGLGSGALLAMSAGVPVIASNVGGIPEAIVDGQNGLLVENTREAVSAAIRRLVEDPELARRIAADARLTIEARFSEQLMISRTIDVYRGLLNA